MIPEVFEEEEVWECDQSIASPTKGASMRGGIRSRGKNRWELCVYLGRGPDGKKLYRWHPVRGTRADAQRELARLVNSFNTGTYVAPTKLTLGEYLERWLADYAKGHVAPTTYQRYEQVVRQHLVPALGHIRLSRLQPRDLLAYYTKAQESGRRTREGGALSSTSVLQHHRILHCALRHAVMQGVLVVNPADRVHAPKKVRREMRALDENQTARLLAVAEGTPLYAAVLLAVSTGLRRGEILGLRWQDVDLEGGRLTVQQTLEETRAGLAFKLPKTAKSRRCIPVPAFAVAALRQHRVEQAKLKLRLGPAYRDNWLVCARPTGEPIRPNSLSPAFAKLVRRAGLPTIRFHDLRHTHASQLLKIGTNPKIVSERLGHSTVGLTLDTYSHVLPGVQEHAVEQFDAAIRAAMEGGQK
jgi:integrase